jgi:glycosyltransferase involved in cell wall biosynthesis
MDGIPVLRYTTPGYPLVDLVIQQARLRALLRRLSGRFDVLQVNHLGPALLSALQVRRASGIPVLLVVWGSCRPGVGPFRAGPKWAAVRALARRVDQVIALSREMADNLTNLWGFAPERIEVIPNGVNTDLFRPREATERPAALSGPAPVAISVGRLTPAKRYDLLIAAWSRVAGRHPDARLVILGEGPLRAELESRIRESKLQGRVLLPGVRSDVPVWHSAADLYISSSDTEGMSNAVLEAMASGLPIVATRVSGSEDLIRHEMNGLLVPRGDGSALAAAVLRLLDHPTLRRRLGSSARETILSGYSLSSVARRYRECYEAALRSRARRRGR